MNLYILLLLFIVGLTIYEVTGKIAYNMEQDGYAGTFYNMVVGISANGILLSIISIFKIYYEATGTKPFLLRSIKQRIIMLKVVIRHFPKIVKQGFYTFTERVQSKDQEGGVRNSKW